MACEPNVGIWILLSDVGVELASRGIVTVLLLQRRPYARVVAGIRARGTVADLVPRPLPLLSAAAAEEQVVVNLVVGCCALAVKDGRGCPLEADYDGGVGLIGPDVTTQAVRLPTKVEASVEMGTNVQPICLTLLFHIGIGSNVRHGQNGVFIGDVGR